MGSSLFNLFCLSGVFLKGKCGFIGIVYFPFQEDLSGQRELSTSNDSLSEHKKSKVSSRLCANVNDRTIHPRISFLYLKL